MLILVKLLPGGKQWNVPNSDDRSLIGYSWSLTPLSRSTPWLWSGTRFSRWICSSAPRGISWGGPGDGTRALLTRYSSTRRCIYESCARLILSSSVQLSFFLPLLFTPSAIFLLLLGYCAGLSAQPLALKAWRERAV